MKPDASRQQFLVLLCIVATLGLKPDALRAAEAEEIMRPRAAEGNLAVRIDEDPAGSTADETSYIITFKNLSDQEVAYDSMMIKFPDLETQPSLLTADEIGRNAEERAKEKDNATLSSSQRTSPRYESNSYYYYNSDYHHHHNYQHRNRRDAEVVGALIIFVAVFVVIGMVIGAVDGKNKKEKKNRIKKENEEKMARLNQSGPIRMLRFQESKRQFVLRRPAGLAIKTIKIEVTDKNQERRTFLAHMNGGSAT